MVLVSRRLCSVIILMTVETALMKALAITTWRDVTLKKTCVHGNSKVMMSLTGPEEKEKLRQPQLAQQETIPWVHRQVRTQTHLVINRQWKKKKYIKRNRIIRCLLKHFTRKIRIKLIDVSMYQTSFSRLRSFMLIVNCYS